LSGFRFTLVAVGKIRNAHLRALCEDHAKRLRRYAKLEIVEVRDTGIEREGTALACQLNRGASLVVLTRGGKSISSRAFSEFLSRRALDGQSSFDFVIGGPDGIVAGLAARADLRLSLSAMTLTHEMARFILLEQLYRAMTIRKGEPYHRG
jgi:23S rRNA (pseudouridine1915-N3)-methyltransferase